MRTVDKLDKIGAEKVKAILDGRLGLTEEAGRRDPPLSSPSPARNERSSPPWRATGAGTRPLTRAWTS